MNAHIAHAQEPAAAGNPVTAIRLVLPYPISANAYWDYKVITPAGKRPMAIKYTTHEAANYKATVAKLCMVARVKPILGRVRIVINLYPHRPMDWAKRARKDPDTWADTVRCLDLDNARKVLYDSLKNIAFEDDKWVKSDGGDIHDPDEHGARVVVTISPIVKQPFAPELF